MFEFGGMDDDSDRVGMQNVRISYHWAWSQGLRAVGCDFFGKEGLQSMIAKKGTTSSWNKDEMEVRE